MLFGKNGRKDSLSFEGVRVVDPTQGIDETLTVTVERGLIASVEPASGGNGKVLAPAFVDPHVHLRTPGREDEEDLGSGTRAAAAGGYCAILAMPNTDPVVDSAAVLGALIERAQEEAEVPVGFLAAITKAQQGAELTEMVELAERGAAGFTDDGRPVVAPGLVRRALQYSAAADRPIAVHCEEPTLSRGGHVHEGLVSAELGFGGYPSVAESVMVDRDLALAAYEERPLHLLHLSARESVDALRRARDAGVRATGEATPHHLCLTEDAVRSLDPNVKMNPPLRADDDRAALIEALRDGTIEAVATDHAPHARYEKEVPFEEAPFGVTGLETAFSALYTQLVEPGVLPLPTLLERMSAGPARIYGLEAPTIAVGAPANLVLLDLDAAWHVDEGSFKSKSANSWLLGSKLHGRVLQTVAAGSWCTPRERLPGPRGRDGLSRPVGRGARDRARRGGLHDGDDRLPGGRHRPELRRAARRVHGPDDRQLRRLAAAFESTRTHARAVLMRRATGEDWPRWLHGQGIVALEEIDTRALVVRLREHGAMKAAAVAGAASVDEVLAAIRAQAGMEGRALVAGVSTSGCYEVGAGSTPVAVLDYGCKDSIIRRLKTAGVRVTVWPHDTDAATILAARPAGVLLSNGPGDPSALPAQVEVVRELLGRVPILGICLGHQLLALAAGLETFKLPFGHRGANHPVLELESSRVLVTSQNHGFAVRGDGPEVTHVSLYDGTVEGLALGKEHARSLQFHPEAGPGPHDAWPEIEGWVEEVRYAQAA